MMKFIRQLNQPALLAYGLTSALYVFAALEGASFSVMDWAAKILRHQVDSDVLVVQFDAKSLHGLGQPEVPYTHQAGVTRRLLQAGARKVFLNFEFINHSDPKAYQDLYNSFKDLDFDRVLVPTSWSPQQESSASTGGFKSDFSFPLRALVSTQLVLGSDALVRRILPLDIETHIPTAVTALAVWRRAPKDGYDIDFSIHPTSFQRLSYIDVLKDNFDQNQVENKIIIVGPTASGIALEAPVPIYRSMPATLVHAFALESVQIGPAHVAPVWMLMLLCLLTAILLQTVFLRLSWRASLGLTLVLLPAMLALMLFAREYLRLVIDVVPLLSVTLLCFIASMLASLNQQTIRVWLQKGEIEQKEEKISDLVNQSIDAILTFNSSGTLSLINPAAERMFGYKKLKLPDITIDSLVPDLLNWSEGSLTVEESALGATREMAARTPDGGMFPIDVSLSQSQTGDEVLYTAIIRDITDRKRHEARLRHQATHDVLTGLANRSLLTQRMENVLALDKAIAVLMIDLNRFKDVNDTLGHDVGDQVLKTVARRLYGIVPKNAVLARIGGDEFAAFVQVTHRQEEVIELVNRLLESMDEPFAIRGIEVQLGMSIGIALAPDHASEPGKLLQCADLAMIQAKRIASGYKVFESSMDNMTVRRLRIAGKLKAAITMNELVMYYQPKVDLTTGQPAGMEALVRWNNPELGMVFPDEFIKLAETSGLVRPLTICTLDMAMAQHAQWRREGFEASVAVNLSAHMIQDPELPEVIWDCLRKHDVDPSFLTLEITESAIMGDPDRALQVAQDVRATGVTLSVDDFGTGYSSLAYLKDLPVQELKIDKSFVLDLDGRKRGLHIVESILTLGHGLGLKIVAEGVENNEIYSILRDIGCDLAQGFGIGRPMPAHQLRDWMQSWEPFGEDHPIRLRKAE